MKQGFTLIELMVVVSISLVLGGSVVVGYSKYSQNQKKMQAVRTFVTNFQYVRSRAITGDKPSQCNGNLQYFGIMHTSSADDYSMYFQCSTQVIFQTVALPSDITVSPFDIHFLPVTNGTSLTNPLDIEFAIGNLPFYTLTVLPSGAIQEEKN